jgi:gliding motility-associated-like protein
LCGSAVSASTSVAFTIPRIISNIADVSINPGDSIQLTATGGSTYAWTPNLNISNPSISNPFVSPLTSTYYTVTITDGSCVATNTILVTVIQNLRIPNIFSPNGDGIHDRWEIENLDKHPGWVVQIYNRYGQMVKRLINYDKPWDGQINGRDAPVGTYYYIIELKDTPRTYTGFVDIIR